MKKVLLLIASSVLLYACRTSVKTEPAPYECLSGAFSVSDTSQVRFSKGNLQYQPSTGTWRFAENQYDVVGGNGNSEKPFFNFMSGNVDSSNNEKLFVFVPDGSGLKPAQIDKNYQGWIDLFGWGTGNSPVEYRVKGLYYPVFTDWGINPIANGGNMPDMWRTLSFDEWQYILRRRNNYQDLWSVGTVCNVNGMILLPDDFELPQGLCFQPYEEMSFRSNKRGYKSKNNYNQAQWAGMEAAGAIFLPAAGLRNGVFVYATGGTGHYWSSTHHRIADNKAFPQSFGAGGWGFGDVTRPVSNGFSVRLVLDI